MHSEWKSIMKKKILAVMVCAALLLTTACSDRTANDESIRRRSDKSSSVRSDNPAKPSDGGGSSAESDSSEAPLEGENSTPADSESSSSTPESSTPEADGKFVHGKVDGNIYTSEFLGFKAEIADGWTITTDEELATWNGAADMSDENLNEVLDVNGLAYEMMALSGDVANVNITVQNLDVTSGGDVLSIEEYIDLSVSSIVDLYTKVMGIYDIEAEKSTANFLGKEMVCLSTKFTNHGVEAVQKAFPIIKGRYMATVTFTAANDDEMAVFLATFKAL